MDNDLPTKQILHKTLPRPFRCGLNYQNFDIPWLKGTHALPDCTTLRNCDRRCIQSVVDHVLPLSKMDEWIYP